jgi:hypothetical protein
MEQMNHFNPHVVKVLSLRGLKPLFGNGMTRIINALRVCRMFNIPTLTIARGYLPGLVNGFDAGEGLKIDIVPRRYAYRFRRRNPIRYIHGMWINTRCARERWSEAELLEPVRAGLLQGLPNPNVSDSTLYMMVRSGDIFKHARFPGYGQPPCSFYLDAMKIDQGHTEVELLTADDRNPCVPILIAAGAKHYGRSFHSDLLAMLYAKRIVVSRTGLAQTVMFLSPVKNRTFYVFGETVSATSSCLPPHSAYWDLGPHSHCEPDERYVQKVIHSWRIKKEQLDLMVKAKCQWVIHPH